MMKLAVIVVIVVLHIGCAPTLYVTYHSDPEGAMLYGNTSSQLFGYTPTTVKYVPSAAFKDARDCDIVQQAMVRWASGATSSTTGIQLCPANGFRQQFVFTRPLEAPGVQIDADFAAQLQRNATLAAQQSTALAPETRPTVHCWSQIIGHQVFTNCY